MICAQAPRLEGACVRKTESTDRDGKGQCYRDEAAQEDRGETVCTFLKAFLKSTWKPFSCSSREG